MLRHVLALGTPFDRHYEEPDAGGGGPKHVVCGACGSRNTRGGEVVKLGADFIEARDAVEHNKKLRDQVTALEATITELKAQITALKKGDDPAPAGGAKSWDLY